MLFSALPPIIPTMNCRSLVPALLCLIAATSALTHARAAEESDAMKTAVAQTQAYVKAFNQRDAKALAAMYAEDVMYTASDNVVLEGRQAVLESLSGYFAENEDARIELHVQSARFLTPEVLFERGFALVGDETSSYVCNYVKEGDAWLIVELNETTIEAGAPEPPLQELAWMVGKWMDSGPDSKVKSDVDWTKNRKFIRRSVTVTRSEDDLLEATEVIGYDAANGTIRSWMFDSEGGFGEGEWRRDGNKWIVSFEATGPAGSQSTAQHVITYVDDGKFTWESINRQVDGEALPSLDEVEVVRVEAQ